MTKELSSRALDGIVDRTLRRAKKVLEEAHRLVDFLDKLEAADKMNFQALVRLGEKAIRKLPVESGGIERVKMHRVRLVLRNGRKVDIHFPATGSDLWIVGAEFADGTYGDRLF